MGYVNGGRFGLNNGYGNGYGSNPNFYGYPSPCSRSRYYYDHDFRDDTDKRIDEFEPFE